ncbi:MAG: FAD-dependent oxidoreductase [Pseudomonadota bacterium]
MTSTIQEFDIVIIGGGIVGAAAACRLSQQYSRIALVDKGAPISWQMNSPFGLRVSALNLATIQLFQEIDIWQQITSMRVYPYKSMFVWEQDGSAEIEFNANETSHESLGAIVENQVILSALIKLIEANNNISRFDGAELISCHSISDSTMLMELADNQKLSAQLLIGADGQRSKVRECIGIEIQQNIYHQQGIVAVVKTEKSHQQTAWQCFNNEGPLALLPLSNNTCSIVWSVSAESCESLMDLSEAEFNNKITIGSETKLGQLNIISERKSFPLSGSQADHYVDQRVALMGDAAHVIHPLAGLGLNLGIADVACFATLLAQSDRELGSHRVLRQYERERKSENIIMQHTLEWIDKLFRNEQQVTRSLRSLGVNMTNKAIPIKSLFMNKALGIPA